MVHALEEIQRLLRPTGTLIDIQAAVDAPPLVEVWLGQQRLFSESDPEFEYEDELGRSEAAVTDVLDRRVFVLEDRRRFELRVYAATVKELREYFAVVGAYDSEEPEEELLRRRDEMYARAQEVLKRAPDTEIVYAEPATMSRLSPIR